MEEFSFTKEDVLATIKVLKEENEKIDGYVKAISAEADKIEGSKSWHDESTQKFVNKLREAATEANSRVAELNALDEILNQSAQIVANAEEQNVSQVGA